MNSFSNRVKDKLKCYVYALVDPRNNKIFYIGKGTGDRVFQHEIESTTDIENNKLNHIRDIKESKNEVKRYIVLYGLSECEAFAAESALINILNFIHPNTLDNIVAGHNSDTVMSVEDIEKVYGAEKLSANDIFHNLLIIKINSLYRPNMTDREIMDCTRGHWVINIKNVNKVDYLIAVYHGLIVGIYENMKWYSSRIKTKFYPRLSEENLSLTNRKYCTCSALKDGFTYRKYIHRNISDVVNNVQNPVSYIWGRKNATNILKPYYNNFINGFNNHYEFDENFGKDKIQMGFNMDAFESYAKLNKSLDILSCNDYELIKQAVSDIEYPVVTAMMFSKWRQMTHWDYSYDIDKNNNFFKAILERIFELSDR